MRGAAGSAQRGLAARKVPRSIHEGAHDMARDIAKTKAYAVSRRQRKKVEMLFAYLKRILRLDRLRLRGPTGARADDDHARVLLRGFGVHYVRSLVPSRAQAGRPLYRSEGTGSCGEHAELTQQAEIVPQCHMLHDLSGTHPI